MRSKLPGDSVPSDSKAPRSGQDMPPLSATLQKTADKGDIVSFGSFPQDDTGRKTPIEWLVLEVSDGTALLLSRYGLAARPYHAAPGAVTWADCDLRGGLNHEFLREAFSEEELCLIRETEVRNDDNPMYHTRGGSVTRDRVFCLSIEEAEHYLGNDYDKLICHPAALARKQGVILPDGRFWGLFTDSQSGSCFWWLRSPGFQEDYAASVYLFGDILPDGDPASDIALVRPALRLSLNLTNTG